MDLRRLIAIARSWSPLLVASVVLAAIAAFAVSSVMPKVYEARATLIVGQSLSTANPDYDQLLVSQRLSTTYASVATTRPILERVINALGLGVTADELRQRIGAEATQESSLLTISVQDASPATAAAIANAVAEQLIAASPAIRGRESEFQASIDANLEATQAQIRTTQERADALATFDERTAEQDAELEALENRLVDLRATYAALLSFSSDSAANLLSVVEPAVSPLDPVSPRPLLNVLLAMVLGLVFAAGVAFVAEYLDDTVKTQDDIEALLALPTLGSIARIKGNGNRSEGYRVVTLLHPRTAAAEAYRTLRANIEFASVDAPLRTLLVTSPAPGEGKTITAANIAVAYAQSGRRVLLVDADLRKPGVHAAFGLANAHGLTTLLRGDGIGAEAITQGTSQPDLRVVTTGPVPPNPAELLGSQRMRGVIEQLRDAADLVIFDSPPVHAVTDAAILSALVDGTLLVVEAGRSRRRTVRLAGEGLARAGAHVLGAVLNRLPAQAQAGYNAYHGYYGYADPEVPGTSGQPSGPQASGHA